MDRVFDPFCPVTTGGRDRGDRPEPDKRTQSDQARLTIRSKLMNGPQAPWAPSAIVEWTEMIKGSERPENCGSPGQLQDTDYVDYLERILLIFITDRASSFSTDSMVRRCPVMKDVMNDGAA